MIKTATFEALLADASRTARGATPSCWRVKTYRITDKDEVRKIAESHGYIIIY